MNRSVGLVLVLSLCACSSGDVPAAAELESDEAAEVVDFVQEAVWSPRGDRLLATWNQGRRFRLYGLMAPDTSGAAVEPSTGLRVSDGPDMWGSWSPDNLWVAFGSTRDGQSEIYRMRPDGMQAENLTNDPAEDRDPAYSPDGREIAFISDRTDGMPRLHLMNANGTDVRAVGGPPGSAHYGPEWSPDGQRIILYVTEEDGDFVYVTSPIGAWGRVRRGIHPSWAADSDLIYYSQNDSLYMARISSGGRLALDVAGFAPRPSPDGTYLAFVRGVWPTSALYALDLETRLEYRLTR